VRIPKYRKNPQRNYGFVEHDGKRHRLPGKYGSPESWEAYTTFIREHCGTPVGPSPVINAGPGLTVEQLVAAFIAHAKGYYGNSGPRGEYANCRQAMKILLASHRDEAASAFGPLKLKAIQNRMAEKEQSRSYINSTVDRIRRTFRWAASEELVPIHVYQALATVKPLGMFRSKAKEKKELPPVPWEHIEPILPELSAVIAGMLYVQWHTGARALSVCEATPRQFVINGDDWEWHPKHKEMHKGKVVVLPIGPQLQPILAPFLNRGPDEYLFNPRAARRNRRYGVRYKTGTYRQAIQRAIGRVNKQREEEAKEAGRTEWDQIPVWGPHGLRRAKGHAIRDKFGIEAVAAVLGHASIKAAELYSARSLELAKRIAREVG
jgi:integrase